MLTHRRPAPAAGEEWGRRTEPWALLGVSTGDQGRGFPEALGHDGSLVRTLPRGSAGVVSVSMTARPLGPAESVPLTVLRDRSLPFTPGV